MARFKTYINTLIDSSAIINRIINVIEEMKEGLKNYLVGAIGGFGTCVVIFFIVKTMGAIPERESYITVLISILGGIIVWAIGYYINKKDMSYRELTKTYEKKADITYVDCQDTKLKTEIGQKLDEKTFIIFVESIKDMKDDVKIIKNYLINKDHGS